MKKKFLKKFNLENDYLSQKDEIMGKPHVVLITNPKQVIYRKRETEPSIDYSKEYFTIEALEDGLSVQLSEIVSHYRIDNGEWVSLSANTATPSINSGQKISFKIINPTISYGIGTFTVNKTFNVEGNIMSLLYGDDFEGQTDLSGKKHAFYKLFKSCTTLQSAENLILPVTTLADSCYHSMFYGCTSLTSAPELPATTLAMNCYYTMFRDCTSLTTAPELPATTLASSCYHSMFYGCTSLTTAPELHATKLAMNCYSNMFFNCTSLTEAPELLATTLATRCYDSMFNGCTSLTEAPELPATTLTYYCYYKMFQNCSNLSYIKMLATDINASSCLYYWVSDVASSGTFIKNAAMTSLPSGVDGIPNGWTIKNTFNNISPCIINNTSESITFVYSDGLFTPTNEIIDLSQHFTKEELLSVQPECEIIVTLKDKTDNVLASDYVWANDMTLGNVLSALVITKDVYDINIIITKVNAPEDSGYYYYYMLDETDYSKKFFTIEALEEGTVGVGIPPSATTLKYRKNNESWIETSEAIQLSVVANDTIQISCVSDAFNDGYSPLFAISTPFNVKGNIMSLLYGDDFKGKNEITSRCFSSCFQKSSIVSAKNLILPATTLAYGCYTGMFDGCTSLTEAPELPATTLAEDCYTSMFYGCTSLTEAPELHATTLASYCYSSMFYGCSKLNYIKMLATDISANKCLYYWVSGVASSGTFVKKSNMTSLPSGNHGRPTGWTVENA